MKKKVGILFLVFILSDLLLLEKLNADILVSNQMDKNIEVGLLSSKLFSSISDKQFEFLVIR